MTLTAQKRELHEGLADIERVRADMVENEIKFKKPIVENSMKIKGLHFFYNHRRDKFRWFHNEYRTVQLPGDSLSGAVNDQTGER